jgi:hypothetical protein
MAVDAALSRVDAAQAELDAGRPDEARRLAEPARRTFEAVGFVSARDRADRLL